MERPPNPPGRTVPGGRPTRGIQDPWSSRMAGGMSSPAHQRFHQAAQRQGSSYATPSSTPRSLHAVPMIPLEHKERMEEISRTLMSWEDTAIAAINANEVSIIPASDSESAVLHSKEQTVSSSLYSKSPDILVIVLSWPSISPALAWLTSIVLSPYPASSP